MGIGRNINHERLDDLRRGRGPVQEHIIDEFVAGRLSRRDFIRKMPPSTGRTFSIARAESGLTGRRSASLCRRPQPDEISLSPRMVISPFQ